MLYDNILWYFETEVYYAGTQNSINGYFYYIERCSCSNHSYVSQQDSEQFREQQNLTGARIKADQWKESLRRLQSGWQFLS